MFDLQTPVVGGSGSHLPIIVGLKTMSDNMGVLEICEGKERLAFPGPGGYKIEWSPGTVFMPLERACSGHLMMPLTAYDKLPVQGGLKKDATPTLHATQADPVSPVAPATEEQ